MRDPAHFLYRVYRRRYAFRDSYILAIRLVFPAQAAIDEETMSVTNRFFVKAARVSPYSPAKHSGTINRRLIGPETGEADRGCASPHVFTVTIEDPVKVLVIYAPPYGESPLKAIRHG